MLKTFHQACYNGEREDWDRVIEHLTQKGEKRMVDTIQKAIKKQDRQINGQYDRRFRGDFGVRFRDGSIAKMDAMIAELELFP